MVGYMVSIKDNAGNIVSQQSVISIDAAMSYAESTIAGLEANREENAKVLIASSPYGALFTGMGLKVTSTVEEALQRIESAITGSVPLPRISDRGKGDTATGVWDSKAASVAPMSFRSVGGNPSQASQTATSNVYEEGLAGVKKIFGTVAQLENDGEPLGELLYAPIVEPEDMDTSGFIMG
tara:strand:- start:1267 stop:1809 length:543 start_codon:yes stop_codon:yes gene_type:complete